MNSKTNWKPEMQTNRYLLASADLNNQDTFFQELGEQIAAMPEAQIVKTVNNPMSRRLVVELPDDAAARLKTKFGPQLIMELDAPLRF
jgi:uncharacterized membrane protein (UPF0127 family)